MENLENGSRIVSLPGLQCGHGSIAVENTIGLGGAAYSFGTSMRPRLDCRGERGDGIDTTTMHNDFNAATARLPWRTALRRTEDHKGD